MDRSQNEYFKWVCDRCPDEFCLLREECGDNIKLFYRNARERGWATGNAKSKYPKRGAWNNYKGRMTHFCPTHAHLSCAAIPVSGVQHLPS